MKYFIYIFTYIVINSFSYTHTETTMINLDLNIIIYNNKSYELYYSDKMPGSDMRTSFCISVGNVKKKSDTMIFTDKLNKFSIQGEIIYDSIHYYNVIVPFIEAKNILNMNIRLEYNDEIDQNIIINNVNDAVNFKRNMLSKIKKLSYNNKNKTFKFGNYKQSFRSLQYSLTLNDNHDYEYKINDIVASYGQWKINKNIIYLMDNNMDLIYQLIIKKDNILIPADIPLFPFLELEDYQLKISE